MTDDVDIPVKLIKVWLANRVLCCTYSTFKLCAGILEQSIAARNRVGIRLSYRLASARIYRPSFHENKPKTLVFT
jgi:hypothetical protein